MKDYFNSISNPQQESNWVDDYAFILSISVLCHKTSDSDDIKSSIQSFLIEPIGNNLSILKDFIVCKCLTSWTEEMKDSCVEKILLLIQ